ncbi:MAG: hypothetical protein ABH952_07435 [Candidatus Omnitrophota bacterium]
MQPDKLNELTEILDEAVDKIQQEIFSSMGVELTNRAYLGQFGEIIPPLIKALYGIDPDQQKEAARLLGIAGGPQANMTLEAISKQKDPVTKSAGTTSALSAKQLAQVLVVEQAI